MSLQIATIMNKFFTSQPIYFFFEKYYLNNFLFTVLFDKLLIYFLFTNKFNEFLKPTIFLELSAFDYNYLSIFISIISFVLTYIIFSYIFNLIIYIYYIGNNEKRICTSVFLYNNLFWSEKEISEMHGITFFEKNDSRHLLLDYSLNGNPMLKNYSISGYIELIFNFIVMILTYIKVYLFESIKQDGSFDY